MAVKLLGCLLLISLVSSGIAEAGPSENQDLSEQPKSRNRRGETVIITSVLNEPYLKIRSYDSDGPPLIGNDRYEGFCADLAKRVCQIIGVDYKIVPVKDGKFGSKKRDGTWDGMIGELIRKEADMAVAPLTITSMRERVVDFSKPFMNNGIGVMMKRPNWAQPGVFTFLKPFSLEIWFCIVCSFLAASVILFLVTRFNPNEGEIENTAEGSVVKNHFSLYNCLWYCVGGLMWKSNVIYPKSIAARIVSVFWWFFAIVFLSVYLVHSFHYYSMGPDKESIPQSVEELAQQNNIKYGSLNGGATKSFFRTSKVAVYERMWAKMSSSESSSFVSSTAEGVSRVRQGRFAFLAESSTIDYFNQRKPCDTIKIGQNINSVGYGIATPLGSNLREALNLAILELRENGEIQRLYSKWWIEMGECPTHVSQGGVTKLGLSSIIGAFIILGAGLGLAILVAVLERFYKKCYDGVCKKKQSSDDAEMS